MTLSDAYVRLRRYARDWAVEIGETIETPSSVIGFGTHQERPVVLKVVRDQGDEWHSGDVLGAFGGRGVARLLAHTEGALLTERLQPGRQLSEVTDDDKATDILCEVMSRMAEARPSLLAFATVTDWGRGFRGYRASGDTQIDPDMVMHAQAMFFELCATQSHRRLLHGDLQHYNVLEDEQRGWIAIDPKGVVGETEYEIGAALRNPWEHMRSLATRPVVEKRIQRFADTLALEADRILRRAYAQAVLSAIWAIDDGEIVEPAHPALQLARTTREMLQ